MQQRYRIRKNGQFQYVYRRGKGQVCPLFALHYVNAGKLQVGFSVSKKIGCAVIRNRVKRRLREAFRLRIPMLKKGFYVFSARSGSASADYRQLATEMDRALSRLKLFKSVQ